MLHGIQNVNLVGRIEQFIKIMMITVWMAVHLYDAVWKKESHQQTKTVCQNKNKTLIHKLKIIFLLEIHVFVVSLIVSIPHKSIVIIALYTNAEKLAAMNAVQMITAITV